MDNSDNRMQLGCGTLILIAIIVAIFSNAGIDRKLDERVERLESRLDSIDAKLKSIADAVNAEAPTEVEVGR